MRTPIRTTLYNVAMRATRLAPYVGAAAGGVAGAMLGAEGTLLGTAAGGVAGYLVQSGADRLGAIDKSIGRLPARMVGSIPTDITDFVGRKRSLAAIAGFIRASEGGVFLIHGFGGCGKSALLKKSLQDDGIFFSAKPTKKFSAAFSWSFSQDSSLQNFFSALLKYLNPLFLPSDQESESPENHAYLEIAEKIERSGKNVLLVLDGIEAVIADTDTIPDVRGALSVPALSVLLQRAVEPSNNSLKVLCTSRIVPPDLTTLATTRLTAIDVNILPQSDAVALLKKKKVRGSWKQLQDAATEFQLHAYSLALLGDLLRIEFRGDVRQVDRILQGNRDIELPIHAILDWYERKLSPTEDALLRSIALFRSPISQKMVIEVTQYVINDEEIYGRADFEQSMFSAARKLEGLGLIFDSLEEETNSPQLTLHPIVREYFYGKIVDPRILHERVRTILGATLPDTWRAVGPMQMKLAKELIFQTLNANKPDLAWRIYQDQIGGYPRLGYSLADHPSGSEIVQMFLTSAQDISTRLPPNEMADLFVDAALYLKNQGRLDAAISTLRRYERLARSSTVDLDRRVSNLLVRAGIELLRGEVSESSDTLIIADTLWRNPGADTDANTQKRIELEFRTRGAAILAVRGLQSAITAFQEAGQEQLNCKFIPHDFGPIRHIGFLTQIGLFEEAEALATKSVEYLAQFDAKMLARRVEAMAALNAAWWGNDEAADYWLRNLHSWALRADIHVFIQTFLVRGVREFRNRQYSEAESALRKGTKFAGDNGFLLEWLDMQVLRAAIAFTQGDMLLASQYSKLALEGDRSTHLVPLEGAALKQVSYWFAAIPAEFICTKANISNAVYSSSLSKNPDDMFPNLSNVLLRTLQNDL